MSTIVSRLTPSIDITHKVIRKTTDAALLQVSKFIALSSLIYTGENISVTKFMMKFTNKNSSSVSIILPTYNERENIILLLRRLADVLSKQSYEIVVVDDDSPDGTWKLVQEEMYHHSSIKLIRRIDKHGLTSALNAGIDASVGDVVVWLDSDFQHPPEAITQLLDTINQGADVASGSRFAQHGINDQRIKDRSNVGTVVWIHGHLSRFLSIVISKVLHHNFTDWTSGLIAVRRKVFDNYTLEGYYGEYYITLLSYCVTQGYNIVEVPYTLNIRRLGESKTTGYGYSRLVVLGLRYVVVVARLLVTKFLKQR